MSTFVGPIYARPGIAAGQPSDPFFFPIETFRARLPVGSTPLVVVFHYTMSLHRGNGLTWNSRASRQWLAKQVRPAYSFFFLTGHIYMSNFAVILQDKSIQNIHMQKSSTHPPILLSKISFSVYI